MQVFFMLPNIDFNVTIQRTRKFWGHNQQSNQASNTLTTATYQRKYCQPFPLQLVMIFIVVISLNQHIPMIDIMKPQNIHINRQP